MYFIADRAQRLTTSSAYQLPSTCVLTTRNSVQAMWHVDLLPLEHGVLSLEPCSSDESERLTLSSFL
jgi:hypothetical protein